jgi:hypothetical protein
MEGRLVSAAIMRLAERDGLDAGARALLGDKLAFAEGFLDGLGFCLSEDGDLLSQWRGYADDARGVAIGFNRTYVESLAASSSSSGDKPGFSLYKVEYDPDQHEAQVEPIYRELRKLINEGALKPKGLRSLLDSRSTEEIAVDDKRIEKVHTTLLIKLLAVLPKLYELKAAAFREEREWRLVSPLVNRGSDDCHFRAARERVIPYRVFELTPMDIPAISKVVLGPKHETPPIVIQSMLKQAGFGDVSVHMSDATYR